MNEDYIERKWSIPTRRSNISDGDRGGEYSNAILFENTLIFGATQRGLLSLYVNNHQFRWELPIAGGVFSELYLDKGTVYFGGGDGNLYAVNAETGRIVWQYSLRNPQISKPVVKGGRLFVTASDDSLYAFDAATGKWLWHYRRRSSQSATILGASQPLVDGNEVIAGFSDGYVAGINLDDGQLKWEKKVHQGSKFTDVDAHPVLDEGVLYIPSYDGSLNVLRRQGQEILWRMDSGASHAVVTDGSNLYYPSSDGFIYSLVKSNGKQNWKFELDGGVPTEIVIAERYVIVGSSHRYLYILDKSSGRLLSRFDVGYGSGFNSSPVYNNDRKEVYILSGGGNLMAFKLTGTGKGK